MATFAEQVDDLTARHARRTSSRRTVLEHIWLALTRRAESRLAAKLGLAASRGTLLRLVHALPDPEMGTVKVFGVDDSRSRVAATTRRAIRRGHPSPCRCAPQP
ncbi:hypothetical protein Lesp02_71610 [Lentzea sp. NBRC 105346]|nr:hypothetical protein Lesp02_71610 [Lentzea sp. NBRC 105346]